MRFVFSESVTNGVEWARNVAVTYFWFRTEFALVLPESVLPVLLCGLR